MGGLAATCEPRPCPLPLSGICVLPAASAPSLALLTTTQMAEADRLAIEGGLSAVELMENAGAAVASAINARWSPRRVSVLCGPGANGGDGYVVARLLSQIGWMVRVASFGGPGALKGATLHHAGLWTGRVLPFDAAALAGAELVVDGLFGAGLSRALPEEVAALLGTIRAPIVSIDVPSGVFGDSGAAGGAIEATLTVTFFRKKPGHLLLPGRDLCGELVVADIGISERVLTAIAPSVFENAPALWQASLPVIAAETHKFQRGHALVWGSATMTGAPRLAARAALRVGAGLVTVAVPAEAFAIYATSLTSVMVVPTGAGASVPDTALQDLLDDPRLTGLLIGPGAGTSPAVRARVLAMLATGRPIVLDADVFSIFATERATLLQAMMGRCCVLTPHEGEFRRLFHHQGDRLARARAAAVECQSVVVLKGSDTVVAAPDGRVAINCNAPPTLATAGAGDVLGGMILGLLAQGVAAFEAACAGVWLHGAAAAAFGPGQALGLIAEDLPDLVPAALRQVYEEDPRQS